MDESINTENKKQKRQKPPLSVGIIAGEIFAGTATSTVSAALAYLFFSVVGYGVKIAGLGEEGCMGNFVLWVIAAFMFMFVPPLYVLGCAIGVYLVGRIGNQTGSLLASLGGTLIGVFIMGILYFYVKEAEDMMLTIEKIIIWPLVFLAAPSMAALGFNLTRRYKDRKNING
jgi:hypothetical protein